MRSIWPASSWAIVRGDRRGCHYLDQGTFPPPGDDWARHVGLPSKTAEVDNDDVMSALLRFENGAQGFMTASRVAVGTGNRIQIEVYGTRGTARFTNEMPTHFDLAIFEEGPAPFSG